MDHEMLLRIDGHFYHCIAAMLLISAYVSRVNENLL
jgi:hypothetical protein